MIIVIERLIENKAGNIVIIICPVEKEKCFKITNIKTMLRATVWVDYNPKRMNDKEKRIKSE